MLRKFFLMAFISIMIVSCGRFNTDLNLSETETVQLSCATIGGIPVFCGVHKETVIQVPIEVIVDRIVEVKVIEEKIVEIEVEKIVKEIEIEYVDSEVDVDTIVDAVLSRLPDDITNDIPASVIVMEVEKIFETTTAEQGSVEPPQTDAPVATSRTPVGSELGTKTVTTTIKQPDGTDTIITFVEVQVVETIGDPSDEELQFELQMIDEPSDEELQFELQNVAEHTHEHYHKIVDNNPKAYLDRTAAYRHSHPHDSTDETIDPNFVDAPNPHEQHVHTHTHPLQEGHTELALFNEMQYNRHKHTITHSHRIDYNAIDDDTREHTHVIIHGHLVHDNHEIIMSYAHEDAHDPQHAGNPDNTVD